MRDIQASDTLTRMPQILDEVERGETIRIKRDGNAIARLVPEPQRRQEEIDKAIESIKVLRKRMGRVAIEEIISSLHEGHQY